MRVTGNIEEVKIDSDLWEGITCLDCSSPLLTLDVTVYLGVAIKC